MDALHEIEVLIRARYPIIYVVSWEERRVEQGLQTVAKTLGRQLHSWSVTRGMEPDADRVKGPHSPEKLAAELEILARIHEAPDGKVFVLKDFHVYLKDYRVIRLLRDLANNLRGSSKTLILLSPMLTLPVEVEKDIVVIEFPLPNRTEIEAKLNDVVAAVQNNPALNTEMTAEEREALIKSAQGLTLDEVESCLARSFVEDRKLSLDAMIEEKKQIISKSGLLEFYPVDVKLGDVGGHELLKEWLNRRKSSLTDRAKQFGIPAPKGILLLGVQGCGKSLIAKSISALWNLPMLRLDIGRVFGSYVGQSEQNMRRAISVCESVAPCVLWVDEIEKGLAGTSGPSGDSGATQRVFATLLSWMQDKTKPVFLVATANNVSQLPPELLRKGRFDEIFFIDLPDKQERIDILTIHIKKRKRNPEDYDLVKLATLTQGFSGAELEQVVIASLYTAFDAERELKTEDLEEEAKAQVPLSRMMVEEITHLRAWAQMRARPSSEAATGEDV